MKRKENEEAHIDQEREREREREMTYISRGGVEGLKDIFNSHPSIFYSPLSFLMLVTCLGI